MVIIVTDEGRHWNHETPILEKYADRVVVVCLNGKKVTDKYKCIVSPYKHAGLGMDNDGILSRKFQALKSIEKELRNTCYYHGNVLFLADNEPQSLYPYLVLKDNEEYNKMHLWCMSPWKIESYKRTADYFELLHDLSELTSLLYIDSNMLLEQMQENSTFVELLQHCDKWFSSLLPSVVYDIETRMEWGEKYYYEFTSGRYISVNDSYEEVLKVKPLDEQAVNDYVPMQMISTLGSMWMPFCLCPDDEIKATVQQLIPRVDGKSVCEQLKKMRKNLAAANEIPYEVVECPSVGPCAGTCAQCDKEIQYLQEQLLKMEEEKRVYPSYRIDRGIPGIPPKAVDLSELKEKDTITMGLLNPGKEVQEDE